jgi:hypothetical protein
VPSQDGRPEVSEINKWSDGFLPADVNVAADARQYSTTINNGVSSVLLGYMRDLEVDNDQ